MRRFVSAALVAVLALVVLAVPASGRVEYQFTVLTEQVAGHDRGGFFTFRDQLFQVDNPSNQVGNDRGRCREAGGRKFRCRAIVHLNGEVGGFGFLFVNGNVGRGDNRLNITGGTDDFAGAAGKVLVHRDHLHFHFVR